MSIPVKIIENGFGKADTCEVLRVVSPNKLNIGQSIKCDRVLCYKSKSAMGEYWYPIGSKRQTVNFKRKFFTEICFVHTAIPLPAKDGEGKEEIAALCNTYTSPLQSLEEAADHYVQNYPLDRKNACFQAFISGATYQKSIDMGEVERVFQELISNNEKYIKDMTDMGTSGDQGAIYRKRFNKDLTDLLKQLNLLK